jgi:hypothetical protein
MRSTAPIGSRSWRCDRPAANACRTKGRVRLRARAGVPALLDCIRTGCELVSGVVSAMGRDPAVDRLGVLGCCGCAAKNGDVRAAQSGCRARDRGKRLRFVAMWEARGPLGRVRAGWWAAISRGCRMHVAASEKPPRGSARRGGVPRSCERARQPAAVGVARSLMDGSGSSAGLLALVSVAVPGWACCGAESGQRRPVARCAGVGRSC